MLLSGTLPSRECLNWLPHAQRQKPSSKHGIGAPSPTPNKTRSGEETDVQEGLEYRATVFFTEKCDELATGSIGTHRKSPNICVI
jgi:hypothetical protein